ncbi:MAG: PilW family protein [Ramlibacter sp.]
MNPRHIPLRARGVTLVELLVSLVLGLVVMLAASQAYLATSSTSRINDAQAKMNEDAQTALSILTQQLKLAGANPVRPDRAQASLRNPLTATYTLRGCDSSFDSTSVASIDALTCGHTPASTGPDAIAIHFEADAFNSSTQSGGTTPTDCVGYGLDGIATSFTDSAGGARQTTMFLATPVYYLSTSDNRTSLSCRDLGSTRGQPLIENIIDLQLRYGTASAANPDTVMGYLTAQQIDDPAGLIVGTASAAQRWALVKTVRVCILMVSDSAIATSAESAQYRNCNGTLVTNPPDLRLRRAYTTTVFLPNRKG